MPITINMLKDSFNDLIIEASSQDMSFEKIKPASQADSSSLCFVLNEKFLQEALSARPAILIVPPSIKEKIGQDTNYIVSELPELLTAKILTKYFSRDPRNLERSTCIHPTAIIDSSATIDSSAIIDEYAIIRKNVTIEKNCYIGPQTIVEEDVIIKEGTTIEGQCFIGSHTQIGKNCFIQPQCVIGSSESQHLDENEKIISVPKNGVVILADNVDVGAQSIIEKGILGKTFINEGTKLDNHILVCSDTRIGKNCLITAGNTFLRNSYIGDYCVFGGKSTVFEHIQICSKAQFAGLSTVDIDIEKPGMYGGHPIQPLKTYLKTLAMITKLPELDKKIKEMS